MTTRTIGHSHG